MSYFSRFNRSGIPFMSNRDLGKMEDLNGKTLHIDDYGWLTDDEGEQYPVISFTEDKKHFYFGGMALTDMLSQVDKDGMREELKTVALKFSQRTSKKAHRMYMGFNILEED